MTSFSVLVMIDVLGASLATSVLPSPPAVVVDGAFIVLHKLEPPERKLPNVMEPLALIKGVVKCC